MRPRRLIMEGFLAYRHRCEVDFTDVDLFVLSGPTGAGKSSVIDGMTFALYGTIPRLDDRRSVTPVISALSDQARVSFEFSVGDEVYTAVRLVHRNRSGEARLQRGEEVLASGPAEVTSGVTGLLGLTYDHFTKAVVLPQGAFADFLTDRPADRQALLRALLEIGLFEQVMQLANVRASTARSRAESMQERLDKLDVPTKAQLEESRARFARLQEAVKELPARTDALKHLASSLDGAKSQQTTRVEILARLEAIRVPGHLETLDQDQQAALERQQKANATLTAISKTVEELDASLAVQPGEQLLESWESERSRIGELKKQLAELDEATLVISVSATAEARDRARETLIALRTQHAAHELRQVLVVGEPCPVCRGPISTLPGDAATPIESIDEVVAAIVDLEAKADAARDRLKVAEGQSKQIGERIAELEKALADAPPPEQVAITLTSVRKLISERADLEKSLKAARAEMEAADLEVAEQRQRAAGLRDSLLAARDRVAGEEPPMPADDVVAAWREFELWRATQLTRRKKEIEEAAATLGAIGEELHRGAEDLRVWLEGLGIVTTGSPEIDLALAVERSATEIQDFEKTVAEATELGAELELESGRARVASALGTHLRSNNFEAWLLEEALDTLIEGANRLLDELSGGAYSLKAREAQFEVIDHRNAGLVRTTKGLSGGETFLVALSLALSMAEQLAELTGMTSRLESVLLDEGFGSLDQESLDVVAGVLDDLVGQGRTVGIVTHVRELADRMPVRFEVSKGPETATVEKVMA